MAIVTGTMETFDQVGIREDLSDIVYNITPTETQFVSGAGRGTPADNTLFEWQTDTLAAADTTNAQIEGDEKTFSTPAATTRVGNYTQISDKTLIVSGTARVVDTAGREDELAYQLAKRGLELRIDIESICLENQAGAAGSTGVARNTATMGAWIVTNDDRGTSGTDSGHSSGVPLSGATDGTQRAVTETQVKAVVESIWVAGGNPSVIMVGPFNKRAISEGFSGIATRNYDLSNVDPEPTASIAAIDVYVTDFGIFRILPNRHQRERDLWILDFEFVEIAELRPMMQEELAKTGDADKRLILTEWGLRVKNEAALGGVFDLNAS